MHLTTEQLDAFHRFGTEHLASGATSVSWDKLFVLWESHNHRAEVNVAIREGIADVDAGRFEPAEEAMSNIRKKLGIQE